MSEIRTTRFSGAEWADQLQPILVIGAGGISSWTILNLARIGHELTIVDPDSVDETNVTGGQMYRQRDVGKPKVQAVEEICREMGCIASIDTIQDYYTEEMGMFDICICGLDSMTARKTAFNEWARHVEARKEVLDESSHNFLFIDGRLTLEMWEVFAIKGNDQEAIDRYKKEHLFSDEEANQVDCTTKQSTFGAMGIASFITGTLCNFLTNLKYGFDLREVPFYHRVHLPMMQQKHSAQVPEIVEKIVEVEKEVMVAGAGSNETYPGELDKLRNFYNVVMSLGGVVKKPGAEPKKTQPKEEVHVYSVAIPENVEEDIWNKL